MSGNTTTLYTTLANVVGVSSNNYTTLYNSTGEQIFSQVPYGNANVEAFLNAGTDGSNTVQNINMSGTISVGEDLTVNGITNLGTVSNVHIDGGSLNYILTTDGTGNLSWTEPSEGANLVPFIHFEAASTGNNQTFTDVLLEKYDGNVYMNVMKNGVNIEPTLFEKITIDTIQINIPLQVGDSIDVLATTSGEGGNPGGNVYEVQINNGVGGFYGSPNLIFVGDVLGVPQINVGNLNVLTGNLVMSGGNSYLGTPDKVFISGGSANDVLTTDGVNLSWQPIPVTTTINADIANVHISGGTNGYVLQTDGAGNLSWTAQTGGGGGGSPGGANRQIQYNNAGIFGGVGVMTYNGANVSFSNLGNLKLPGGTVGQVLSTDGANNLSWTSTIANATFSDTANYANFAGQVVDSSQPNITSFGTLTGLTSGGTVNFTTSSNVTLGIVGNVHISGGTNGQVLTTDGSGTLSWANVGSTANANYANFAGQVVDSNQSNITSLGTLSNVTVSGNATIGNVKTDNLLYANGTPWPTASYGNANVANYLPTFTGNLNPSNLTATTGNIATLYTGNIAVSGGAIKSVKEPVTVVGTSVGANTTIDLITDTVWYYTSPLYNNTTLQVRGNSTVTANTMINSGESITFSTIFTNSANISLGTGVVSNLQIDGTTQTIRWVGSAPSAILNGLDVYAFTLIKTGANTYTVLGSRGTTT